VRRRGARILAFGAVVAVAWTSACDPGPPSKAKGAPSTPPDESYQLGAVGYERGFIWHCVGGHRVHVWCSCGELVGCGKWLVNSGPCGAPLASEPPQRGPLQLDTWR
jgi:hypothetical protein